ncbi:c-type cytochrome [Nannocystis punicea]|uniref:Cytochrome c n=1 Tax=Nannocystis punicea TaxID=2995304 RepID=A0ABY7HDD5_9BACT|nr:cytochrome c [Nannocystis poenicansa]WAS97100.1 cytochrome c [Nannocystis poenicansa]
MRRHPVIGRRPPARLSLVAVLSLMSCETGPKDPVETASVPAPTPAAPPVALEPAADPAAVARGQALIDRFECVRCHDIPGREPAPLEKHCVRCHQDILAGQFPAPPETLREWQGHIVHLTDVPALRGTDRLRRAWLADWLHAPHDLRPGLNSTMPRLSLGTAEAADLAAALVPDAEAAAPPPGAEGRGRELFGAKSCGLCHRFTGAPNIAPAPKLPVPLDEAQLQRGLAQAPDLRFTRERMRPAALVAWLLDPPRHKPGTPMPKIPLEEADARALAAYVTEVPLEPLPAPKPVQRLPLLDRRVTWAEVEAKVFKKTCWHCHSDPDYARGDGGPGNSGGYGFAPRRLDLASYTGIASGSVGDDGKRRSVFAPLPDGTPRIVAHMLARHAEVEGAAPEQRGMPLGLTPVPLTDIQLVDTWIAQGRPQ